MRLTNIAGVLARFVSVALSSRVDTHFHALPAPYLAAVAAAGGDPSGFPSPAWTIEAALKSMNSIGTSLGIMSVSSPGVGIAGTGDAGRVLARTVNGIFGGYLNNTKCKGKLGFFGALPDFQDVNGTLAEIDYLYKEQNLSAGVTVFTSYGGKLLGAPEYAPIWKKLNHYKALIFLHPSVLEVTPFFIGPAIPQPIVDYPLATTRAAVDLVMTGTLRACPNIDIILSHVGGTIPFVGSRAINSLALPDIASLSNVTITQAKADFGRFYYDTALSTSAAQLNGLLDFTSPDRILFGSDFPYAPQLAIDATIAGYAKFVATDSRGAKIRPEILRQNSLKLLNKHSQGRVYK
ncbi:hypothetical protein EDB81DRAFT_889035 [Dactylonectria macrodidyma]|uniref:6-methylsalicylate decarboxylase n=1 Tax=Dactylonectria macrodidyma TaxID=307937 RepID=A0A9P9IQE3_9HYPO|nr:hypothetical protein EDB81DRAFT_889035 [Dactylonectria macrodidyma]